MRLQQQAVFSDKLKDFIRKVRYRRRKSKRGCQGITFNAIQRFKAVKEDFVRNGMATIKRRTEQKRN